VQSLAFILQPGVYLSNNLPLPLSFHWKDQTAVKQFRTGVSLHSHTMHSKELLDFIPRMAAQIPVLQVEITRLSRRFEAFHGGPINFNSGWWTPPLDPLSAVGLESSQIINLGLAPLVSLTDHDNLDASRYESHIASVELTVKLPASFIHLGIHNLPHARAHEVLAYGDRPAELMKWLRQFPNALLVFNHPLWDEAGIGGPTHRAMAEQFITEFHSDIHALELNGLRPWKENNAVIELATRLQVPLISGGDRHGTEPNANINLTNAASFDEFVDEIRRQRRSHIHFLPQYKTPYALRIADNLMEILRDTPGHALGWSRWSDRVFYEVVPGQARSLSEYWTNGEPTLIRTFVALVHIMRASSQLPPVRFATGLLEECRP
jgi:hypothetical protein